MKTVTYECDNCERKFYNVHEILEISSKDNSLGIINNAKGATLKTIERHQDLHFCSQNCLNNYLFQPLNSIEVIVKELERLKKNYTSEYSDKIFGELISFLNQNINQ